MRIISLLIFTVAPLLAAEITTFQNADIVLGQTSFTSSTQGVSATTMFDPKAVAVDPTTGKVYVADRGNNRVLRFASTAAMTSGAAAEIALGQATLTSNSVNGASQTSMFHPSGVACDNVGRLYVADTGYNRVLRFNSPSTALDGAAASAVLGQADFTSSTATTAAAGMSAPTSVTVGSGYLWVADTNNHRVIGFSSPASKANGASADKVLGQANLTTKNAPTPPNAASMSSPEGVVIGSDGVLWVADTSNNRLLRFIGASALANGSSSDAVLGQSTFVTNTTPSAATAANMYSPEGLTVDESGTTVSLWVVDRVQDRVLRFDDTSNAALADGANATIALGQASLTTDASSGATRRTFSFPFGVAIDAADSTSSPRAIWVADAGNNRVLRFNPHDPAPPVVTASSFTTKKKSGVIKGRASSQITITQVKWKGSKGGYKSASGTTSWSFRSKFKVGKNRFTVIAVDSLGQSSSPKTIIVKRKK